MSIALLQKYFWDPSGGCVLPVSCLDRQPPEVSKWQLTKRAALTESLRKLSQTCVDAELRSLAPGGPHRWRGAIPLHIGHSREVGIVGSQPEGGEFSQAGALLTRKWKGKNVLVEVLAKGFLYENRHYTSLSAIAVAITGTRWNGLAFFGLTRPSQRRKEQERAKK